MKLPSIPYPFAIALATSAVFGAAIGSTVVATLMHSRIIQSNASASSLAAMCTTKDNSPEKSLSLATPEAQAQTQAQPERPVKGSSPSPASGPIRPKQANPTPNVSIAKAVSKTPMDHQPVVAIPIPATAPVVQPKDHILTKPSSESKIEAVYATKAGVSKVDPDAVTLLTGARIAVGDRFPSGETLVQIDAINMRLFTDRRQLILFTGKEGHH